MKEAIKIGFSFGLTSGIITTLGLMVGLHSSTDSKFVVIGGILTIAIADAFSESMGIHAATETENRRSKKEVWESTFSTFIFKFIFTVMFIIPVLLFDLHQAILISILIGFYFIIMLSIAIARERNIEPWKVVVEHLMISILVLFLAHCTGLLIAKIFS